MQLNFRRAVSDDLEALVALLVDDPLGATRENPPPPLDPRYAKAFAAIDTDPNNELVLLEADGRLAGMMQLTFIPYLTHTGSWRCLVEGVRVAREFRGQGLGTQMLEGALGFLLTATILAALGRSRVAATADANARLRHPPGLLWIGVVCFGLFAGLAIVSRLFANPPTAWWTSFVFIIFALLGALLIAEYWRVHHAMNDTALHYRGLVVRRFSLPWNEIRSVRYSGFARWFVLRSRRGDIARISILLRGLPTFARRVLGHAPSGAIDPPTRALLREIAQGRLPPLA